MNGPEDLTDYRSLSLAALVQAAELVHACAHGTSRSQDAEVAVKHAIRTQHAESLREVFPDKSAFRGGIDSAIRALSGAGGAPEVLRYTLQLIDLAKRLRGSAAVRGRLEKGLNALPVAPSDPELGALYQDTISTLGKRIQVTGNPNRLREADVADNVRALLLAGIRFAWLWQQLGGSRWQLILSRRSVLSALQSLQNTF